MSVLECDRVACENIMCILDGSKYICRECWIELVEYKETWPKQMTKSEVRSLIEEFMETRPGTHAQSTVDTDEEFNRLTDND